MQGALVKSGSPIKVSVEWRDLRINSVKGGVVRRRQTNEAAVARCLLTHTRQSRDLSRIVKTSRSGRTWNSRALMRVITGPRRERLHQQFRRLIGPKARAHAVRCERRGRPSRRAGVATDRDPQRTKPQDITHSIGQVWKA